MKCYNVDFLYRVVHGLWHDGGCGLDIEGGEFVSSPFVTAEEEPQLYLTVVWFGYSDVGLSDSE